MLDDLKLIHQRDKSDLLGAAERQPRQLAFRGDPARVMRGRVDQVVFVGMGTAANTAELARAWLAISVPFIVVRDYTLPAFVGPQSLVIAGSYTGDTDETMNAVAEATVRGAAVVVLTAGGTLASLARKNSLALLLLPTDSPEQFTRGYMLQALVAVLEAYGLAEGAAAAVTAEAPWLERQIQGWLPTVATARNLAKQLALELLGKTAIVYAGPKLFAAARHWKAAINENAKQLAWCGQYPEFNHAEFTSWSQQPVQKPFAVVELRSQLEHPQIRRRFVASEKLLSGMRPAAHVVELTSETALRQLLYTTALGDFTSLYLGLLNNSDPGSSRLTKALNKELAHEQ